jgi:hypothetical protein
MSTIIVHLQKSVKSNGGVTNGVFGFSIPLTVRARFI